MGRGADTLFIYLNRRPVLDTGLGFSFALWLE
jgi:hypothetical protein